MPENNDGGLNPLPAAGGSPAAVAALLQQLAGLSGSVRGLKVKLDLEFSETAVPETTVVGGDTATLTRVRQKLDNGHTALSQIPDDPQANIARDTITTANEISEDKIIWEELLGDPALDIDQGIILLRINEDGNSGVITWLPNDAGAQPIHRQLMQVSPTGAPVDGLKEFNACYNNNVNAMGEIGAFSHCLPEITST